MAYISYCWFNGIRRDLRDCLKMVDEHLNGEAELAVSDDDIDEFREMVTMFVDWLHDNDILDDEGELDADALNKVCDAMKKA